MIVGVKKLHTDAVIPKYSKKGDAGLDLTAVDRWYEGNNVVYGTGLAIEIPYGYVGLIFPRSSVANVKMTLTNCVGVVDSGYRGELLLKFKVIGIPVEGEKNIYSVGERIGQLMIIPYPEIELQEVDELETSERGVSGYGSTG